LELGLEEDSIGSIQQQVAIKKNAVLAPLLQAITDQPINKRTLTNSTEQTPSWQRDGGSSGSETNVFCETQQLATGPYLKTG
jgi:hypothetical protein